MKVCINHKHCVRRGETYQIIKGKKNCDVCESLDCVIRELLHHLRRRYAFEKTKCAQDAIRNIAVEINSYYCELCHFIACDFNPIRDSDKTWFEE